MPTTQTENGPAQELQRLEQEFAAYRKLLREESDRFAQWQANWDRQQQVIDASLMELKERLHSCSEDLSPMILKLVTREQLAHQGEPVSV